MRQIEVSTDVFARIWSRRLEGEDNESQILDRILREPSTEPEVANSTPTSNGHRVTEVFQSKKSSNSPRLRKARWVDDVYTALEQLGGRGRLFEIYKRVESIREAAGRSIPRTLEATIRRTLEDYSSDSSNFRGTDLFWMPEGHGAGLWAVRS